jgi:hypothetical protein
MGFGPDHERCWSAFEAQFNFWPNVSPEVRPGIREPAGSVTLSLAPIFDGTLSRFATGEHAVNAEVLRSFVAAFDENLPLIALNWQHESYWFRPHLQALHETDWYIPPFPNGDYYVFLTEDMSAGTFGHPWEQSLCIFGHELVAQLAPALGAWLPILRVGGEPVVTTAP